LVDLSPSCLRGRLRRVAVAVLVVGCALLCFAAAGASADTQVTGDLTLNTTWSSAGSPYVISSGMSVRSGVTLTIQAGTTVQFSGQLTAMTVDGDIRAQGTQSSPVVFTSVQDGQGTGAPGQYTGVNVDSGDANSRFSYVTFRYGGYGTGQAYAGGALSVSNHSAVRIDHADFENNLQSGLQGGGGSETVSASTFSHNGDGISEVGGAPGPLVLSSSTVSHNSQDGVFFNITDNSTVGSSLTENTITANGRYGINVQNGCSMPVGTWPHGEANNIYNNGATLYGTNGGELNTSNCVALAVDWKNNYWGPTFIDSLTYERWPNGDACTGPFDTPSKAVQPDGFLAYSTPANWTGGVRPGPIQTSYNSTFSAPPPPPCPATPLATMVPVFNAIYIGPNDIQPSPVGANGPVPTGSDLFGGTSKGPDGALEASPSVFKCHCGDPVDSATGNFTETVGDLVIPGFNGGLSFARTYNSQAATAASAPGPLGYGWSFTFGDSLALDPTSRNATVTQAQGATVRFYSNPDGSYNAPPWVQATLVHNGDGTYTYALPDQRIETFSGDGRLLWTQDRNANRTTLSYSSGVLSTVTTEFPRFCGVLSTCGESAAGRMDWNAEVETAVSGAVPA
jgi:hypothetical protein